MANDAEPFDVLVFWHFNGCAISPAKDVKLQKENISQPFVLCLLQNSLFSFRTCFIIELFSECLVFYIVCFIFCFLFILDINPQSDI